MLFEALTGTRAWTGDTTDAIALARVGAPAPSAMAVRPEVPAALDDIVRRALAPEPGDRYPNGTAMAAALEAILSAADVASNTSVVLTPVPSRAAPAAPARTPAVARPIQPRGPDDRPFLAMPRVFRSGGASAVLVAIGILGVVSAGLLVATRPGDGATPLPTERPAATDTAIGNPTDAPEATPVPTPDPTPSPAPAASTKGRSLPPGDVADLCDTFFDIPCGLAAARYAPSRFSPAFDIELGEGWSNARHTADTVALAREEGVFTFAGKVVQVYPNGEQREPRARARALIEAFIATDGVSATRPAKVRIDGRRGLSSDLTPIDSARIQLFATAGTTYFLEPDRTTRVVVMDLPGATILMAIEPREGLELDDILATADDAAGTIRWR